MRGGANGFPADRIENGPDRKRAGFAPPPWARRWRRDLPKTGLEITGPFAADTPESTFRQTHVPSLGENDQVAIGEPGELNAELIGRESKLVTDLPTSDIGRIRTKEQFEQIHRINKQI